MSRFIIKGVVVPDDDGNIQSMEVLRLTSICLGNRTGKPCPYLRAVILEYPRAHPWCTEVMVRCGSDTKGEVVMHPPQTETRLRYGDCPRKLALAR